MAASLCYYAVFAGTPLFRDAFSLSGVSVGLVVTSLTLGYATSLLPLGARPTGSASACPSRRPAPTRRRRRPRGRRAHVRPAARRGRARVARPLLLAHLDGVGDDVVGSASAGGQFAATLGGLLAPPAFGYLVEAVGYGAGWRLLGVLSVLGVGLVAAVTLGSR